MIQERSTRKLYIQKLLTKEAPHILQMMIPTGLSVILMFIQKQRWLSQSGNPQTKDHKTAIYCFSMLCSGWKRCIFCSKKTSYKAMTPFKTAARSCSSFRRARYTRDYSTTDTDSLPELSSATREQFSECNRSMELNARHVRDLTIWNMLNFLYIYISPKPADLLNKAIDQGWPYLSSWLFL